MNSLDGGIMLEKLAQVSYRYYQEARFYVIATIVVFGMALLYVQNFGWNDSRGFGSVLLFLGVFGHPIMLIFCFCVFYLSFVYAFHPELNGKEQGNFTRLVLIRILSITFAAVASILLYMTFCCDACGH